MTETQAPSEQLTLTSPAFADGQPIPREYTCHGSDQSPALTWRGVPAGAEALVLFVDDPDGRDWVHWTVLDLPARDGDLPKAIPPMRSRRSRVGTTFARSGMADPVRRLVRTTTGSRSTRSQHRSRFRRTPTVARSEMHCDRPQSSR